jgi:hypothetical protein
VGCGSDHHDSFHSGPPDGERQLRWARTNQILEVAPLLSMTMEG